MAPPKISVFDAVARRMDWLGQRQRVLSQNIANADTPGYVPKDLKEAPFAQSLRRAIQPVRPQVTNAAHMNGTLPVPSTFREDEARDRYETAPSGNAVTLEEELVKVSDTQMDYQTMTNLYSKHLGLYLTALGRGR